MKVRSIFLGIIAAAIIVPAMDATAFPFFGKKKKAKIEADATASKATPKKKATPYEKLMKDVCDSATGPTFTLYRTAKDKFYMGLPKSYMGKRILVGSTVSAVSNAAYIDIGYKYTKPVCLKIELADSVVVFSMPGANATSSDPAMTEALEKNYLPRIVRRVPVKAYDKDSSTVIFEVTGLIGDAAPKSSNFSLVKASDTKTTWYGDLKSFEDNASVKVFSNVDFTKSFLGLKARLGSGTLQYTVSFLMLPETLMRPRIQDSRVGIFPEGPSEGSLKYDISSKEDGFRGYLLASRWRLELADTAAWLAGGKTTVKTPIVWYVDNTFPESWKKPVKDGILAWNKAFEAIGLEGVMQVRDFPTSEEDPEFDPDNLKYSCIRYVPNASMNAMGPSWRDPVTGEILNASVLIYNDVIKLINNWRFVQTSQVDPRVRSVKMPQEVLDESLVYVVSHEIGHTLGLMHNMGASSAYPTDSLRDPVFTATHGTTPSIMDYARFNYVAQPGDTGVKLVPPSLGVYDMYAIKWLYTPVPQAKDMWEEAAIASKILDEKDGDPEYRYGAQQMSRSFIYAEYDPSARNEDLGDDPIKSGNYGISNLKYILSHMNGWLSGEDRDYSHRNDLYSQIYNQYYRYISHVLAQVGGIYLGHASEDSGIKPAESVPASVQASSLKWAVKELSSSAWLDNKDVTGNLPLAAPASNKVCLSAAKLLSTSIPKRVILSSSIAGEDKGYSLKDYYDDLFSSVYGRTAGKKLTSQEKTLQRALLNDASEKVKSVLEESLQEESLQEESECPDGMWCGCEVTLGEGNLPYQKAVDTDAIDEMGSYRLYFVKKVRNMAASARHSGTPEDRAHYEYIYTKASAALEK